jgi:hypothetical protein
LVNRSRALHGRLIVSAVVLPELRLLHVLQALIYVAIVILARRSGMWAIGAGLTIAVAWNSLNPS